MFDSTIPEESTPAGEGDSSPGPVAVAPDSAPATEAVDADNTPSESSHDETFPRKVVEELRRESARYRERARVADGLARRLHTELVRATGRLADPTDLPFDAEHLDSPEALDAAVGGLLEAKPHLASRRPVGDVGQGRRGSPGEPFSLLGLLKERT